MGDVVPVGLFGPRGHEHLHLVFEPGDARLHRPDQGVELRDLLHEIAEVLAELGVEMDLHLMVVLLEDLQVLQVPRDLVELLPLDLDAAHARQGEDRRQ